MHVERKNFILSKNSNRNNYREHCINQIPCTAVLGGGQRVVGAPLGGAREKRMLRARCEKTLKMTDTQGLVI